MHSFFFPKPIIQFISISGTPFLLQVSFSLLLRRVLLSIKKQHNSIFYQIIILYFSLAHFSLLRTMIYRSSLNLGEIIRTRWLSLSLECFLLQLIAFRVSFYFLYPACPRSSLWTSTLTGLLEDPSTTSCSLQPSPNDLAVPPFYK